MLNIFNNGSQLWILFIALILWVVYFGYKTYKSHKSGYIETDKETGFDYEVPANLRSLVSNANFKFLVLGIVFILFFIWLINSDYR